MSQVWSREDCVDERPTKNYPQKLTTQRQKSFESHLSSALMRVKLVFILFPESKIQDMINIYFSIIIYVQLYSHIIQNIFSLIISRIQT